MVPEIRYYLRALIYTAVSYVDLDELRHNFFYPILSPEVLWDRLLEWGTAVKYCNTESRTKGINTLCHVLMWCVTNNTSEKIDMFHFSLT